MLKTLVILGILAFVIWFFFLKKRPIKSNQNPTQSDEMFECKICGTFASKDEAILSNGSYYCSKECLLQG